MDNTIRQYISTIYSEDKQLQGASFQKLIQLTNQPVDWAYEVWDNLLELLKIGNNTGRAIAAQVLCNLAKSDPKQRMVKDLDKLFIVTKDEKFVTARHTFFALWKVAIVNNTLQKKVSDGLSKRFKECIKEKNCTLIRYDITCVFRKIVDHTLDEKLVKTSLSLIDTETDDKYRKKYLTVWKDIMKKPAKKAVPKK
jgi:hypothetical protein